jgi:hypothetical protein
VGKAEVKDGVWENAGLLRRAGEPKDPNEQRGCPPNFLATN